jgi:hypothetical protein
MKNKNNKMKKIVWWVILILWSIPETFYMIIFKNPSKIAEFLFKKVNI